MEALRTIVKISRIYGTNPDYVLAGGGNTSCKQDGVLCVKASGTSLADIDKGGFVRMDLPRVLALLEMRFPTDDDAREAAVLAELMAARLPGQGNLRPSVECLLHALFPQTYVVHLHPALVNGLTCGQNGAEACQSLFNGSAVRMPLVKPGYALGRACADALSAFKTQHNRNADILLMQNHGLVVAADTPEGIDKVLAHVMDTLAAKACNPPAFVPMEAPARAEELAPALRGLYAGETGSGIAAFGCNAEILAFAQSEAALQDLRRPFTPDQIVYCKADILYLEEQEDPAPAFAAFIAKNGYAPKIAVVKNVGFFALGKTKKEADIAALLFTDTIKIVLYARAFGGPLGLPDDFTDFILNWEVENYRQKVSLAGGGALRMQGKVCVVTGAAQGFGAGIAGAIAEQGGYLVIADMNEAGAAKYAEELCARHGAGTAVSVAVNVADDASVQGMIRQTVLAYGGVDVLVSCAGIVISGSLVDMTKEKFDKVTAVNYTGYFLCAKYGSLPMKRQRAVSPAYTADIIEINSKSGLEGSKANFAYAGSKFGGVGLTQSFALELAAYGIKVNAICPGNLLDGPLWSDPERGLFRQYLEAGKVPGAKTVADVRRFYEAKVPLGRGCRENDVARAVFYLVEQQYETGQALPVTGGQVMLN